MHKRVLVAEAADTTRTVAESVLRQNGFEVISVMSAEKALEVLQFTTPDVLIIGGELRGPDGRPFYERIQDNPKTSSLPLLLFDSADSEGLPFPDEVIIARPFDPKDFIQRVLVFSGQARESRRPGGPMLDAAGIEDEFLDAALGIDHLDVTESEIMDRTQMTGKLKSKGVVEKLVGMDHYVEHDETLSESQRVESLMIRDDDTQTSKRKPAPPAAKPGTGKIEILDDQFGISDPASVQGKQADADHDYNWFIDSMRSDVAPAAPSPTDSHDLAFESTSVSVDPVTPPPKAPAPKTTAKAAGTPASGVVKKNTAGVEKFIDEFREEMERIRADVEPEMVAVKPDASAGSSGDKSARAWEERLENLTPEHVALFSKQLATELGRSLAQKLIEKIDSEKLIRLIAAELAARIKQDHS